MVELVTFAEPPATSHAGILTACAYDDSNELINGHRSSATGGFNTTNTYDPVGNCLVKHVSGNRPVKNESGSLTTSTFDAANQTILAISPAGTTTFTFDAAGSQQIEVAPGGITTRAWDYQNQETLVLLPSGQRETMTYNADQRQVRKDP